MTDMVYVAPAVLAPLACLAAFRLARPATRAVGIRLLVVLGVAMLALVPIYLGYAGVARANPRLFEQTPWPTAPWPMTVPRDILRPNAVSSVPTVILWLILAGAVSRLLHRRHPDGPEPGAWAHGSLWVVVGIVASLTQIVVWHGINVPTPQLLLSRWIPALRSVRDPQRLGIAALMGFAILGGVAFTECVGWFRWSGRLRVLGPVARVALALLVLAGLCSNNASFATWPPSPLPLMEAPQMSERLLAPLRAGHGPLVELPIGPRPIDLPTTAMYRSIGHWRPLLNGYGSYFPAGFPERMALATALPDPTALATLVRDTGLTTILVHTRFVTPEKWSEWLAAQRRGDVQLLAVDDRDYLFAVTRPTPAAP
jgi:hypothetical protein